jgi:hypothetical protein
MSGPRPLTQVREHTGNRQLDGIQRDAKRTLQRVNSLPFANGVLRSVEFTAATPKTVDHGLGTRATFIVVRTNYDGTGTASTVTEASDAYQDAIDLLNQLAVVASATCLVDLWFYPIASEVSPR